MNVSVNCILCFNQREILEHLFFECDYSKSVWMGILNWMGGQRTIPPWTQQWFWVKQTCNSKTPKYVILKVCFVVVAYKIWGERNARLFQHKITTQESSIHTIQTVMRIHVRHTRSLFYIISYFQEICYRGIMVQMENYDGQPACWFALVLYSYLVINTVTINCQKTPLQTISIDYHHQQT